MRDAFGGIFMIRLLLIFIVIYVAFTAISLNYAKAFRIKNKVISFIEENEIYDLNAFFTQGKPTSLDDLEAILTNANYSVRCNGDDGKNRPIVINSQNVTEKGEKPQYCYHGVWIRETLNENNTIHYEISTKINWNLGVLSLLANNSDKPEKNDSFVNRAWRIYGEAKVIKRN